MKKIIILVIVLFVLVGFYFVSKFNNKEVSDNTTLYTNQELGLEFSYKDGPDGYVLEDITSLIGEQQEGTEIVKAYRLINIQDKIELENSEDGREGPAIMTVMVFKNLKNQSASMWVDTFTTFSNLGLVIGSVDRDAVVGGANAVKYRTDGLYQNQNVVISSGGYIYLFSGSFMDENSDIFKDFNKLVDSINFIPFGNENMSQSKIDPKVACQSALAYMTFNSGDEADKFVSDCIEGKYPEVIERYISDMNLDGASI